MVSVQAQACPRCGASAHRPTGGSGVLVVVGTIVGVALLFAAAVVASRDKRTPPDRCGYRDRYRTSLRENGDINGYASH